jgi:hypothetical protein
MSVWSEAVGILFKDKVELMGEGNNRQFWEVGGVQIALAKDYFGMYLECTCKHHSIHSKNHIEKGTLCAHTCALVSYLTTIKCHGMKKKQV